MKGRAKTTWWLVCKTPLWPDLTEPIDNNDPQAAALAAAAIFEAPPYNVTKPYFVYAFQFRTAPTFHRSTRASGLLTVPATGSPTWEAMNPAQPVPRGA